MAKQIAGSLGGREPGVEGMNCFWRIFGVEEGLLEAADSGIEAFLEVRKRKKGLARGCFKNLFCGIRKRR